MIFSEHYGENRFILLQTVAEWWCIKLCAFFSGPLCIWHHPMPTCSKMCGSSRNSRPSLCITSVRDIDQFLLFRAAWNATADLRWERCPFVKRVQCDKTKERSIQLFIPYERLFSLVFPEKEWLVGATPSVWNFGSTGPRWSEIVDFEQILARSASAITPSEKSSINTNRKFPMSLRWSSYVALRRLNK